MNICIYKLKQGIAMRDTDVYRYFFRNYKYSIPEGLPLSAKSDFDMLEALAERKML